MSAETLSQLEEAIRAHVADEAADALAGGWVLAAECLDQDPDEQGIDLIIETGTHQSTHLTTGLLFAALRLGGSSEFDALD